MTSNMYELSVDQWNVFAGCEFHCRYCKASFQRMLKRQKHNCPLCYQYVPHFHPERLTMKGKPRTGYLEFIWPCSSGDISFCPTERFEQIFRLIKDHPERMFLLQSKNPAYFWNYDFPKNVVLGTTIESNRDYPEIYSGLPPTPSERYQAMIKLSHPHKMVTIEPIMDFDLEIMVQWMEDIRPKKIKTDGTVTHKPMMIWMGYDSKNCGLPEPSIEKFRGLHWELSRRHFIVVLKKVKEVIDYESLSSRRL